MRAGPSRDGSARRRALVVGCVGGLIAASASARAARRRFQGVRAAVVLAAGKTLAKRLCSGALIGLRRSPGDRKFPRKAPRDAVDALIKGAAPESTSRGAIDK